MRSIFITCAIALIIAGFSACKLNTIKPQTRIGKVDTNYTLIADTALVGKWTVVSDSISFQGSSNMYHGTADDHFTFTKHSNLFIKEGLNNFIDTAIYSISTVYNQVGWANLYVSVNGVVSTEQSYSSPYDINLVNANSLVLTANIQTIQGPRYEQIKLSK